ncbi:uncharacterized protein EDB91DRAFT_1253741 [Suillus paluster]|uniref:uncharacterized protein n=1 Tax=Suillus paluster TaxID=48578 RepID=UPI001B8842F1|nr:uncharacterized protein EDB91DRAFT_1253741 [Suillus paluster]KAG1727769.1 hypothetical protein EDB91DRAFT_1253741 [Suillus paluster]
MEKECEAQSSDDEMADSVEGGDNKEDKSKDGESKEEDAINIEGSADEDGNEDKSSGGMDGFGYTSLDQVLVEDEDNDALLGDDALGAEDGEEVGLNYDEVEGIRFADL